MLFQRFLDDRGASVVPLLGLAVIPLMGLIAAAVDSTSVAMFKSAASLTEGQLQTNAQAYDCAGTRATVADAGKFYLLTTPDQIITTFNQIGTGLSKLRISL